MFHYFYRKNGRAQHAQISLVVKGITTTVRLRLIKLQVREKLHTFTSFFFPFLFFFEGGCASGKFTKDVEERNGSAHYRGSVPLPSFIYIAVVHKKKKNSSHSLHNIRNF